MPRGPPIGPLSRGAIIVLRDAAVVEDIVGAVVKPERVRRQIWFLEEDYDPSLDSYLFINTMAPYPGAHPSFIDPEDVAGYVPKEEVTTAVLMEQLRQQFGIGTRRRPEVHVKSYRRQC